jgi:hypothetical protein
LFAYNEDHRYKPQNEPAEWLVNIMPAFAPPPHASPRRISEPRSRLVDTRSSRVAPSWSFDGQLAIARVLLATLMISTSAVVAYVENESVKMYTFIAFVVLSAPLLIWHEHLK